MHQCALILPLIKKWNPKLNYSSIYSLAKWPNHNHPSIHYDVTTLLGQISINVDM